MSPPAPRAALVADWLAVAAVFRAGLVDWPPGSARRAALAAECRGFLALARSARLAF